MAKRLSVKPLISSEIRESAHFVAQSAFWAHLDKVMKDLWEQSLLTDSMDISKLSVAAIAEGRGIRRAITAIREELQAHLL